MYGLVNKAIEDLVTEQFGREKWEAICVEAGHDDLGFIGMKSYPDELTYRLVGAASKVLGAGTDELLEAFGEYWILYTGSKGYGPLMDMAGSKFQDFLKNLDFLHHRVSGMMPQLAPPSFSVRIETPQSMELVYRSHRHGMVPMLKGLIRGLGKKFNQEVTVELLDSVEEADHTLAVLLVKW